VERREERQIKVTMYDKWVVLRNGFFVLDVPLKNDSNAYVTYIL
jgi:hypothetical protein